MSETTHPFGGSITSTSARRSDPRMNATTSAMLALRRSARSDGRGRAAGGLPLPLPWAAVAAAAASTGLTVGVPSGARPNHGAYKCATGSTGLKTLSTAWHLIVPPPAAASTVEAPAAAALAASARSPAAAARAFASAAAAAVAAELVVADVAAAWATAASAAARASAARRRRTRPRSAGCLWRRQPVAARSETARRAIRA